LARLVVKFIGYIWIMGLFNWAKKRNTQRKTTQI